MTTSSNLPSLAEPARHARAGGFTLIEIMVVVAILAIVSQLVISNIGAIVPGAVLDSEAQKLMSEIEYLRSEAQLQGKTYKLEIDLDQGRFRRILPPELKVAIDQEPEEYEEATLDWNGLDERVRFGGYEIVGGLVHREGRVVIPIDHNGFTADQTIFLRMKSEDLKDMIWTIQVRGLDRRSQLVRSVDGNEARVEPTTEAAF